MEYQQFLIDALNESAEIARKSFGKVSGVIKPEDNNQVLTQTDLDIGTALIKRIKSVFPEHNIIDEEARVIDHGSSFTWGIDPIDGTSNFAQGIPLYGTIIGLLDHDQPIAGGVALPFFEEVITAERGKGAFCNGERLGVTGETRLASVLVSYMIDGHQEEPDLTREECKNLADIVLGIRNVRTSGSVFDVVMVAKGKYGGALNLTSKIWDNVGQQVIIEEAGGIYTDFYGKPMDYSNPLARVRQNFTWCISTPKLHSQLQEIIHKN